MISKILLLIFINLFTRHFLVRFFAWYENQSTSDKLSKFLNSRKFRLFLHIPPVAIAVSFFLVLLGVILIKLKK